MKFTMDDVAELAAATKRTQDLKKFVLERADQYRMLQGKTPIFHDREVCESEVDEVSLFNLARKAVRIDVTYMEPGYGYFGGTEEFKIPRAFIFDDNGDAGEKLKMLAALKAELEDD